MMVKPEEEADMTRQELLLPANCDGGGSPKAAVALGELPDSAVML
jgi:hypothetical protein